MIFFLPSLAQTGLWRALQNVSAQFESFVTISPTVGIVDVSVVVTASVSSSGAVVPIVTTDSLSFF